MAAQGDLKIRNLLHPEQGAVVIGDDVFGVEKMTDKRPYVVISNKDEYPVTKQYNAMVVSTKNYDGQAIPLSNADFEYEGGFEQQSFACPWATVPLKHRQICQRLGALEKSVVKQLVQEARDRLSVPETTTATCDTGNRSAINAEG